MHFFSFKGKTAKEVSMMLEERVLAYFGPPKIFHSDNGREFVNQILQAMFERWGGTTFVNGRPRHSQSQGLVERGNRIVEKKIAAMKQDEEMDEDKTGYPWASWLPRIMFAMNSARQETIKDAPYHVVFGRSVPAGVFPGGKKSCVNEECLGDIDDETAESKPIPVNHQSTVQVDDKTDNQLLDLDIPYIDLPNDDDNQLSNLNPSSQPQTESDGDIPKDETRHTSIRKRALDNTYVAAAKMCEFYNKRKRIKVQEFSVGDRVSVAVPKLDRSSTDMSRIPCVINKVHGKKVKSYSIGTEYGTLNTKFTGGDLQEYSGAVEGNNSRVISLRQAAQRFHPENKFVKTHCNCKGGCKTDKCTCKSNKIICSTHCHPASTCANNCAPVKTDKLPAKSSLQLLRQDCCEIDKSTWMSDLHLSAASQLLKKAFPSISGLQHTILQQNMSFDIPTGKFVQFLHVNGNHWITISNMNQKDTSTVCIYDSMRQRPSDRTIQTIAGYRYSQDDKLSMKVMNVDRQPNLNDCGVYAIAFATSLLYGEDPTELHYDILCLRKHFKQCIDKCVMTPFPSTVKYRCPTTLFEIKTDIYCNCRCPDDAKLMIQCDKCQQWYHSACIKLTKKPARKWKCKLCRRV